MAVSRKFIALAKQTNCSGKKEPTPLGTFFLPEAKKTNKEKEKEKKKE